MTCYAIKVHAISEETFAIRGYGPKSGITDVHHRFIMSLKEISDPAGPLIFRITTISKPHNTLLFKT